MRGIRTRVPWTITGNPNCAGLFCACRRKHCGSHFKIGATSAGVTNISVDVCNSSSVTHITPHYG